MSRCDRSQAGPFEVVGSRTRVRFAHTQGGIVITARDWIERKMNNRSDAQMCRCRQKVGCAQYKENRHVP